MQTVQMAVVENWLVAETYLAMQIRDQNFLFKHPFEQAYDL